MLQKDYKEIIYEIRGSDLPSEKLDYTIPENILIQRFAPGVSGKQDEIDLTERQHRKLLKLGDNDKIISPTIRKTLYTLCSCKKNDGSMHETKLVNGKCKFCNSEPFIGEWNFTYTRYNKKWDRVNNFTVKTQDEKDNFLALAKNLRYNKTHIADATGLHINTVRYRLKKWRKDV